MQPGDASPTPALADRPDVSRTPGGSAPAADAAARLLHEGAFASDSVDRVIGLAARLLDASVQVSLLADRQVVTNAVGPDAPQPGQEFDLSDSLCAVVSRRSSLAVNDLLADPDLCHLSAVTSGGLRAYLAVALRDRHDTLVGTLAVYGRTPRDWTSQDRQLLEGLAPSVVTELELRARTRELEERTLELQAAHAVQHDAALVLQRDLLPSAVSTLAMVTAVARYRAAERSDVGGDWYDVIDLGARRSAFVVGDVMGRGLHAAALMGQLRTAVRAYARLDLSPADVLSLLDDLVTDGLTAPVEGQAVLATCLYAVHDPAEGSLRLASAGHPRPLIVEPTGWREVELPTGPPLGVGGQHYLEHETVLPPDAYLALYTDGLLNGLDSDQGATSVLGAALQASAAGHLTVDCAADQLMEQGTEQDDAALLVVRPDLGPPSTAEDQWWPVPADARGTAAARRRVRAALSEDADTSDTVQLVVSELIGNALRYGQGTAALRLRVHPPTVYVEVEDNSTRAPTRRSASSQDEGGRGLELLTLLTQRWGWRTTDTGKVVWAEVAMSGDDRQGDPPRGHRQPGLPCAEHQEPDGTATRLSRH